MLDTHYSSQFKKDFKACVKRGYKMYLLHQVIDTLRIPTPLSSAHNEHKLSGNYSGYKECHITPDWLLIYKQTDTELKLNRTGTHADLFNI